MFNSKTLLFVAFFHLASSKFTVVYVYGCFVCVHVSASCTFLVSIEEGIASPEIEVTACCRLLHGCWDLNLDLVEELDSALNR